MESDPFQPTSGQSISSSFTPAEAPVTTAVEDTVGDGATNTVVSTIGETIGETVGETALAAVGVAAEAVPVIGTLVGLGIGLYDLFHALKKPNIAKNNVSPMTSGELTVPSYDSVSDNQPGQGAF
jgi:hypothetical protein